MKQILRLFLSLSFFLLGMAGSVRAIPAQVSDPHASIKKFHKLDAPALAAMPLLRDAVIGNPVPGEQGGNNIIYAEETEDESEEWLSLKRRLANPHYFADFYAQIPAHSCFLIKDNLPVCKFLSYISSHRYLLLRVIKV